MQIDTNKEVLTEFMANTRDVFGRLNRAIGVGHLGLASGPGLVDFYAGSATLAGAITLTGSALAATSPATALSGPVSPMLAAATWALLGVGVVANNRHRLMVAVDTLRLAGSLMGVRPELGYADACREAHELIGEIKESIGYTTRPAASFMPDYMEQLASLRYEITRNNDEWAIKQEAPL
jgi:hypothetical protein